MQPADHVDRRRSRAAIQHFGNTSAAARSRQVLATPGPCRSIRYWLAVDRSAADELFAREGIRSISDLKGKSVGVQASGRSPNILVIADGRLMSGSIRIRDIHWVTDPTVKPMSCSSTARSTLPRLSAGAAGTARPRYRPRIVNTAVDRPWSQYFCCMLGGNPDFVRTIRSRPSACARLLKAADLCATRAGERGAPRHRRCAVSPPSTTMRCRP